MVLDVEHPERSLTLSQERLHEVAISRDGRTAATATWQRHGVKIWDTRSGKNLRELPVQWSASVGFSRAQ